MVARYFISLLVMIFIQPSYKLVFIHRLLCKLESSVKYRHKTVSVAGDLIQMKIAFSVTRCFSIFACFHQ